MRPRIASFHFERCPTCALTTGLDAEVSDTHVSEACCDAEVQQAEGPERGALTRTIPPKVRRSVVHADGWRCAVPRCSNRLWLDVHHVPYRQYGGRHDVGNLPPMCGAHHRGIHDGHIAIGRDRRITPFAATVDAWTRPASACSVRLPDRCARSRRLGARCWS